VSCAHGNLASPMTPYTFPRGRFRAERRAALVAAAANQQHEHHRYRPADDESWQKVIANAE
jgi:hypothetical protein